MTDQLIQEDRISSTDLAKFFGVTSHTVLSWMEDGYHGQKLESYRIGRKRFSTRQAAARFLAVINGAPEIMGAAI